MGFLSKLFETDEQHAERLAREAEEAQQAVNRTGGTATGAFTGSAPSQGRTPTPKDDPFAGKSAPVPVTEEGIKDGAVTPPPAPNTKISDEISATLREFHADFTIMADKAGKLEFLDVIFGEAVDANDPTMLDNLTPTVFCVDTGGNTIDPKTKAPEPAVAAVLRTYASITADKLKCLLSGEEFKAPTVEVKTISPAKDKASSPADQPKSKPSDGSKDKAPEPAKPADPKGKPSEPAPAKPADPPKSDPAPKAEPAKPAPAPKSDPPKPAAPTPKPSPKPAPAPTAKPASKRTAYGGRRSPADF